MIKSPRKSWIFKYLIMLCDTNKLTVPLVYNIISSIKNWADQKKLCYRWSNLKKKQSRNYSDNISTGFSQVPIKIKYC